jgi:tripartite-type tricarboxylate transporter receptor subunit TctC
MKHKPGATLPNGQTDRRRIVAAGLGALVLPALRAPAWAQEAPYPNRPVRLIVPLGAGSSPDVRARALAERLSVKLGQRLIV